MSRFLQPFSQGQGYLKAGFLGFPGSGKSHTAALLAIAVRDFFKLEGPIAMYDTETGGAYLEPLIMAATGKPLVGIRSRAFSDLMGMAQEAATGGVSVLIVDSITHPWRELCAAYLAEVNAARASQNRAKRTRVEFQDWNAIKEKWGAWPDFYLNSPLHIIICGRAGWDWDFEEKEDATGQTHKELVKTGVKMKVEGEFGFEPSLLVNMERVPVFGDVPSVQVAFTHRATVLKDRFRVLDGKVFDNPTGESFMPHVRLFTPGAVNAVDTAPKTPMGVDEAGDAQWQREKRQRTVLCEEIEGLLVSAWPGQTKEEKKLKADAIEAAFGTRSWTLIQTYDSARLSAGLETLKAFIQEHRNG